MTEFAEGKVLEIQEERTVLKKEAKSLKQGLWRPKRGWEGVPGWGIVEVKGIVGGKSNMSLGFWGGQFSLRNSKKEDWLRQVKMVREALATNQQAFCSVTKVALPSLNSFSCSLWLWREHHFTELIEWMNDQMTLSWDHQIICIFFWLWVSILICIFYFSDFFLSMRR